MTLSCAYMEAVKTAIEALQRAREIKQQELQAIEQALQSLGVHVAGGPHPLKGRKDFEDLGITTATRRYLGEVGEPRTTREIADALRERGVKTRSKKYIASVYATLHNSPAFKRTEDGRWQLSDLK
jgi:hypothetical protein